MKNDPSAIAIAIIGLAIALHMGVIGPMMKSIGERRSELTQEELRLSKTRLAITQAPGVRERIAELQATNAVERTRLISPLLNSYAMRVKTLVSDLAFESGLTNVEYDDAGFRALPIPKERLPTNRTGRHGVLLRAQADYAAIASFLLRAERDLPLMSVQSVTILPAGSEKPELQRAEIIVEWPCEGEVIR